MRRDFLKKNQARGYLLEDVLEKLIEINGYEIITREEEGVVKGKHNGLNVIGRGGYHQADSLGKLRCEIPFIYQIRLFVEAKYNSKKIGIDTVRQGIGLLSDINSNHTTVYIQNKSLKMPLHNYHYVIFSASGFTKGARLLALAHKIFLVDLNDEDYKDLKQFIEGIIDELFFKYSKNDDSISIKEFMALRENIQMDLNGESNFLNYIAGLKCKCDKEGRKIESKKNEEVKEKFLKFKEYFLKKSLYFVSDQYGQNHCILSHDDENFRKYLLKNPHSKVIKSIGKKSKSLNYDNKKRDYYRFELYLNDYEKKSKIPLSLVVSKYNIVNQIEIKNLILSFIAYLDGKHPTICTLEVNNNID